LNVPLNIPNAVGCAPEQGGLARVSQFARHKDASITATLYAHLSQEGLVEIADYSEQHSARRETHPAALSVPQP
jgi:hypothetical protein